MPDATALPTGMGSGVSPTPEVTESAGGALVAAHNVLRDADDYKRILNTIGKPHYSTIRDLFEKDGSIPPDTVPAIQISFELFETVQNRFAATKQTLERTKTELHTRSQQHADVIVQLRTLKEEYRILERRALDAEETGRDLRVHAAKLDGTIEQLRMEGAAVRAEMESVQEKLLLQEDRLQTAQNRVAEALVTISQKDAGIAALRRELGKYVRKRSSMTGDADDALQDIAADVEGRAREVRTKLGVAQLQEALAEAEQENRVVLQQHHKYVHHVQRMVTAYETHAMEMQDQFSSHQCVLTPYFLSSEFYDEYLHPEKYRDKVAAEEASRTLASGPFAASPKTEDSVTGGSAGGDAAGKPPSSSDGTGNQTFRSLTFHFFRALERMRKVDVDPASVLKDELYKCVDAQQHTMNLAAQLVSFLSTWESEVTQKRLTMEELREEWLKAQVPSFIQKLTDHLAECVTKFSTSLVNVLEKENLLRVKTRLTSVSEANGSVYSPSTEGSLILGSAASASPRGSVTGGGADVAGRRQSSGQFSDVSKKSDASKKGTGKSRGSLVPPTNTSSPDLNTSQRILPESVAIEADTSTSAMLPEGSNKSGAGTSLPAAVRPRSVGTPPPLSGVSSVSDASSPPPNKRSSSRRRGYEDQSASPLFLGVDEATQTVLTIRADDRADSIGGLMCPQCQSRLVDCYSVTPLAPDTTNGFLNTLNPEVAQEIQHLREDAQGWEDDDDDVTDPTELERRRLSRLTGGHSSGIQSASKPGSGVQSGYGEDDAEDYGEEGRATGRMTVTRSSMASRPDSIATDGAAVLRVDSVESAAAPLRVDAGSRRISMLHVIEGGDKSSHLLASSSAASSAIGGANTSFESSGSSSSPRKKDMQVLVDRYETGLRDKNRELDGIRQRAAEGIEELLRWQQNRAKKPTGVADAAAAAAATTTTKSVISTVMAILSAICQGGGGGDGQAGSSGVLQAVNTMSSTSTTATSGGVRLPPLGSETIVNNVSAKSFGSAGGSNGTISPPSGGIKTPKSAAKYKSDKTVDRLYYQAMEERQSKAAASSLGRGGSGNQNTSGSGGGILGVNQLSPMIEIDDMPAKYVILSPKNNSNHLAPITGIGGVNIADPSSSTNGGPVPPGSANPNQAPVSKRLQRQLEAFQRHAALMESARSSAPRRMLGTFDSRNNSANSNNSFYRTHPNDSVNTNGGPPSGVIYDMGMEGSYTSNGSRLAPMVVGTAPPPPPNIRMDGGAGGAFTAGGSLTQQPFFTSHQYASARQPQPFTSSSYAPSNSPRGITTQRLQQSPRYQQQQHIQPPNSHRFSVINSTSIMSDETQSGKTSPEAHSTRSRTEWLPGGGGSPRVLAETSPDSTYVLDSSMSVSGGPHPPLHSKRVSQSQVRHVNLALQGGKGVDPQERSNSWIRAMLQQQQYRRRSMQELAFLRGKPLYSHPQNLQQHRPSSYYQQSQRENGAGLWGRPGAALSVESMSRQQGGGRGGVVPAYHARRARPWSGGNGGGGGGGRNRRLSHLTYTQLMRRRQRLSNSTEGLGPAASGAGGQQQYDPMSAHSVPLYRPASPKVSETLGNSRRLSSLRAKREPFGPNAKPYSSYRMPVTSSGSRIGPPLLFRGGAATQNRRQFPPSGPPSSSRGGGDGGMTLDTFKLRSR